MAARTRQTSSDAPLGSVKERFGSLNHGQPIARAVHDQDGIRDRVGIEPNVLLCIHRANTSTWWDSGSKTWSRLEQSATNETNHGQQQLVCPVGAHFAVIDERVDFVARHDLRITDRKWQSEMMRPRECKNDAIIKSKKPERQTTRVAKAADRPAALAAAVTGSAQESASTGSRSRDRA